MEEILPVKVNETFNCSDLGPKRDSIYIVVPMIVIYVIIFITGTVGNISTCIVINKNKSMHTATNYYLFSLAISDLLLLITGLPQEIYLILFRWPYIFGSTFCFLRGIFAETSSNATVLTITAFTVERYLAICHPFLSHTMSKLSRAVKFILGIWIAAIFLAIPQAMQFQIVKFGENCEMCMVVQPMFKHSFEVSTLVFFVAPMTLITVLYVLIALRLKSSRMMKKRNANTRMQSKSSRKVLKMLVAVVVAFFICWAPFHTQRLYTMHSTLSYQDVENRSFYLKIYEIVTYVSGIFFYMSATINPILYNIMSIKFREAFKETFARCFGFGLQRNRPERSYSVLSRSNQRGPDSGDSAAQMHTSLTQKSSVESFSGPANYAGKRVRPAMQLRENEIEEEETVENEDRDRDFILIDFEPNPPKDTVAVPLQLGEPRRFTKLWKYFENMARRHLDDSKGYSSGRREKRVILKLEPRQDAFRSFSPCDISNSSLKEIENGAIEDELSAYMDEVRMRDFVAAK